MRDRFGQLARRAATILVSVSLVISCSSSELGANKLENYISRLSHAAEVPIPEAIALRITKPPAIAPPPAGEDADTLSLIDFLALSGCELQANIAKRNTTMGKNASASQKLIFDLEFIRLAPACMDKLRAEDEADIADLLEISLTKRNEQLVYTVAQAILGGTEWREFWRAPELLDDYPANTSGDAAQSLWELSQRIKRFLNGNWSPADEALEPLLATIRVDAGGQLLRAAMIQEQALTQANQILTTSKEAGKYCAGKRQSQAGTISKTIVAKYFAGDVQVWSSAVSQRHYEIQIPLAAIEKSLATALTDPYTAWAKERDTQLNALFSKPRQHVSVVQAALESCEPTV